MREKHAFNQAEILMLSRRAGTIPKVHMWDKFTNIAKELGFNVRTTGGNFLTHEINGSEGDFIAIAELAKG